MNDYGDEFIKHPADEILGDYAKRRAFVMDTLRKELEAAQREVEMHERRVSTASDLRDTLKRMFEQAKIAPSKPDC